MSYFDEIDKSVFDNEMINIPKEYRDKYYKLMLIENVKFKKWFKFYYPFFHNLRHENKFVKSIIEDAFRIWVLSEYEIDAKYESYLNLIRMVPALETLYHERSQPGLNSIKSFIMYCAFKERLRLRVYGDELLQRQ